MLQNLLTERFGLTIQQERKSLPVSALAVAKRLPLKESATGKPGCKRVNEDNLITLTCRNTTMAALAESLPGSAPAYFVYAVADRTELKALTISSSNG